MAAGIGAGGFVGFALETTAGTYVAPAQFWAIRSENIQFQTNDVFRRNIRGIADEAGAVAGTSHIEGPIEAELFADMFAYLLYTSRNTVVKSGTGPYVYTFTPGHGAVASNKTMSVTVVRNGVVHGFVGCVLGSFKLTTDTGSGIALASYNILGLDEATQTLPTLVLPSTVPFGAGTYSIEVPTATQVFDASQFELNVDDNVNPEYRLKSTRSASFIKFGERSASLMIERDFDARTELDAFKALTASSVRVKLTKDSNNIVQATLAAAVRESYEISGLSGQGDIIMAKSNWRGQYDATTSKAYELVVTSALSIV